MLSCSLSEWSVRRLPSWVLPLVASLTDIDDRGCHYSATVVDMRSSRLLAILMELTRLPRTTVATLAERYGVSSRTIQRDISALHEMGVPVWTCTGPAGGIGLVEGWRSPITGMTAPELQALIIGEAGARGLGLHTDFETARLKMLTTNAAQAETVEPAQERFLIDNERWFSEPEHPAALPDVARAVWSGRRLTIDYQRPGGERTPRRRLLDPLGLVLKTDSWYLVAAHRRSLRTYRLSRASARRWCTRTRPGGRRASPWQSTGRTPAPPSRRRSTPSRCACRSRWTRSMPCGTRSPGSTWTPPWRLLASRAAACSWSC